MVKFRALEARAVKFLSAVLVVFIASILQAEIKFFFGWSPDFALATLITLAFYFGSLEVLFLSLLSAIILNWQPAISLEIFLLIALPLLVSATKRYFLWRVEINHFLAIISAFLVFYGASNYISLVNNPLFFAEIIIWASIFGIFIFQVFRYFYSIRI